MKKIIVIILIIVLIFIGYRGYKFYKEYTGVDVYVETENKEEKQEDSTSIDEELYQELIAEYKKTLDEFYFENFDYEIDEDSLLSLTLIEHVARYKAEGVNLTYDLYDIDSNGVDELIVEANGAPGAIYSYDTKEEKVVKIFFQDTMERGNLIIYDNGTILSEGSGGATLHYYEFGRIARGGTEYERFIQVEEEYLDEENVVYKNVETGHILNVDSLDEIMDRYIFETTEVEFNNSKNI